MLNLKIDFDKGGLKMAAKVGIIILTNIKKAKVVLIHNGLNQNITRLLKFKSRQI